MSGFRTTSLQAAATRRGLLLWVAFAFAGSCNNNAGPLPTSAPSTAQPNVAPPRPTAADLQAFLHGLITDPTVVDSAHLTVKLQASAAIWQATVIAPFTDCRAASEQALAAATPTLWTALRARPTPKIAVRKHYAGDSGLPAGAAHLRWALPVLFDSYVVALDDQTVDLVFWANRSAAGWRWFAMGNIDAALAQAITQGKTDDAMLARCAAQVVASQHDERCLQLAAAVVLAALRNDRNSMTHACALANVHCTEGS